MYDDVLAALQHPGQTSLNQAYNRLDLDRPAFIEAIETLRARGAFEYCGDPRLDESWAPFAAICYTLADLDRD